MDSISKSKQRLPRVARHITVRLILIFVVALIPLSIFTLLMLREISDVNKQKLLDSYSSSMALYIANLDANVAHIENLIVDYLNPAQISLMNDGPSTSEAVAFTRISDDIKRIRNSADIKAISFVIDNNGGHIALSHAPHQYTYLQLETLKTTMLGSSGEGARSGYNILYSGDDAFLARRYDFSRYSFGILIDLNDIIESIHDASTEAAYMALRDGTAVFGESKLGGSADAIKGSSATLGYDFFRLVPESATSVPMFATNLRFIAIACLLTLPLIWLVMSRYVLKPLGKVGRALAEIEKGNLDYRLSGKTGTAQMDYIQGAVNHMAQEIQSLITGTYEKEVERLKTEAVNLRLQLKPHLLLNSLNTICSLAQSGMNKQIVDFSMCLAKYFRCALSREETFVALREEIELIANFLEIQKMRFPDSFVSTFHIEPGAENVEIPPLIVENFVENTVKYALVIGATIEISVSARIDGDFLAVAVSDTGGGIEPQTIDKINGGEIITDRLGDHLGIWNCRRRLKLYYGDAAVFGIRSAVGEGTTVELLLPRFADESG